MPKSIRKLYYNINLNLKQRGETFNPLLFAITAQNVLKEERVKTAELVANSLGLVMIKSRQDGILTDRQYRRAVKFRINSISYCLLAKISKEQSVNYPKRDLLPANGDYWLLITRN